MQTPQLAVQDISKNPSVRRILNKIRRYDVIGDTCHNVGETVFYIGSPKNGITEIWVDCYVSDPRTLRLTDEVHNLGFHLGPPRWNVRIYHEEKHPPEIDTVGNMHFFSNGVAYGRKEIIRRGVKFCGNYCDAEEIRKAFEETFSKVVPKPVNQ